MESSESTDRRKDTDRSSKMDRNGILCRIYSGWLGKMIGVRLGAPIEMWTRERIEEKYHGQHGYLLDA